MAPIRSVSQAWRIASGEAPARPRRKTPTARPPGHDRPARSARPQRAAPRSGGSGLWAHHRPHRGRGLPLDLHFLFQVADPGPGPGQLSALLRRRARLQAPVHQIAMPPPVQARLSDPQRRRHIADSAAQLDQIEGTAAEFGRIRPRHRLIPPDCRAPAISRHASPQNRSRSMYPRYEGKPRAPITRICMVAGLPELDCAADHIGGSTRAYLADLSRPSAFRPSWAPTAR
jgi:hypothetical protein